MTVNFYLPGLNHYDTKQDTLSYPIKGEMMKLFYNDASNFCRTYCDCLGDFKIREKRFLDFETPNRAVITHEYDIMLNDEFDYNKFYYIFNPSKRLSRLKVSQGDRVLPVTGQNKAKEIIKKVLEKELSTYTNPDEVYEELWSKKKGFPCFIKLDNIGYKNFVLTALYHDSINEFSNNKPPHITTFLSPLLERRIKYDYFPLKDKSSWLYIKSPSNFNIKYNHKTIIYNENYNNVVFSSSHKRDVDVEKISVTIENKRCENPKTDTVVLYFDITVPRSLKIWLLSIYYLSLASLLLLIYINISVLYPQLEPNIINKLIENNSLGGVVSVIIAAIIATRSWLISEETILKRYSINITIFMILIIICYITLIGIY